MHGPARAPGKCNQKKRPHTAKTEKRKNQTACLQPAANKKREQSKSRHHENRRRGKSIAKNRRRQVSKCTGGCGGGGDRRKLLFFSRKTIEFGAMAMDTNKHTQAKTEETEDEKHKACMGLGLS
jgi:hypothetical protein